MSIVYSNILFYASSVNSARRALVFNTFFSRRVDSCVLRCRFVPTVSLIDILVTGASVAGDGCANFGLLPFAENSLGPELPLVRTNAVWGLLAGEFFFTSSLLGLVPAAVRAGLVGISLVRFLIIVATSPKWNCTAIWAAHSILLFLSFGLILGLSRRIATISLLFRSTANWSGVRWEKIKLLRYP